MPVNEVFENTKVLNTLDPAKKEYWDCWSLETHRGRQVWKFKLPEELKKVIKTESDWQKPEAQEFLTKMQGAFVYNKKTKAHSSDLVYRTTRLKQNNFNPLIENTQSKTLSDLAKATVKKGFHFYQSLQTSDGNWPGDYGGPLFLLPGMVIVSYLTKTPLPGPYASLCKQYMLNMQNEDGGWGLHIEGKSTMLGTVLQYAALRILGENKNEHYIEKARKWIHENGGANYIPTWGKFYLSLLNVYEWKGFNSILPELWVFPKWMQIHPSRYWCHARMVHMPMAYCYANKVKADEADLINELREELYTTEYKNVNWKKARNQFCKKDLYTPHSRLLNFANRILNIYEKFHLKFWRKSASKFLLEQMNLENKNTFSINLGPINHVLNSLSMFHAFGKDSKEFKKNAERWFDYLWLAEDGMKMNGYNGSQLWDTSFAALALMESGMEKEFPEMGKNIYRFLDDQQGKAEIPEREKSFRSIRKGGWNFSTADHGWPISDCTSEGMKASISFMHSSILKEEEKTINIERLKGSVDVLLSCQNRDGGWPTYEAARGPKWLELLNASEVFGNIMIDYSYTECTSACLQALAKFRKECCHYRLNDIHMAIRRGNAYLKDTQRIDGSWLGAWAICFTYATWFGVEGLLASGEKDYENESGPSPSIIKACEFLLSIQKIDGGWGEHYESCVQKKYVEHPQSQITNTAWALLALLDAKHPNREAIDKGIKFLISMQDDWGDFPQQQISGVFNYNCMITYTAYRNIFPLWALSRYSKLY